MLRLYYGVTGGTPWTQPAISAHLGLPVARVKRLLLAPAVARLLSLPVLPRQTLTVPCASCGAAVERPTFR